MSSPIFSFSAPKPPTGFLYTPSSTFTWVKNIAIPVGSAIPTILPPDYTLPLDGFFEAAITTPLPGGVTVRSSDGALTGTPTLEQTSQSYIIRFVSANGSPALTQTISIQILLAPIFPTSITYVTPRTVLIGSSTITSIRPTVLPPGSENVLTFSLSGLPPSGLPASLALNSATGEISGLVPTGSTPTSVNFTVIGTYTTTPGGLPQSRTPPLQITTVATLPPHTSLTYAPAGEIVLVVNQSIVAPGYVPTTVPPEAIAGLSFRITPDLPAGLSLHPNTGIISGMSTFARARTIYYIETTPSNGVPALGIPITVLPASGTAGGLNFSLTATANRNPLAPEAIIPLTGTLTVDSNSIIATSAPPGVISSAIISPPIALTNGTVLAPPSSSTPFGTTTKGTITGSYTFTTGAAGSYMLNGVYTAILEDPAIPGKILGSVFATLTGPAVGPIITVSNAIFMPLPVGTPNEKIGTLGMYPMTSANFLAMSCNENAITSLQQALVVLNVASGNDHAGAFDGFLSNVPVTHPITQVVLGTLKQGTIIGDLQFGPVAGLRRAMLVGSVFDAAEPTKECGTLISLLQGPASGPLLNDSTFPSKQVIVGSKVTREYFSTDTGRTSITVRVTIPPIGTGADGLDGTINAVIDFASIKIDSIMYPVLPKVFEIYRSSVITDSVTGTPIGIIKPVTCFLDQGIAIGPIYSVKSAVAPLDGYEIVEDPAKSPIGYVYMYIPQETKFYTESTIELKGWIRGKFTQYSTIATDDSYPPNIVTDYLERFLHSDPGRAVLVVIVTALLLYVLSFATNTTVR